jgi:hypothetical protein
MQDIVDPATALNIDPSKVDCPAAEKYKSIVNQPYAKASWQKYSSGLKAFACFEADNRISYDYPLSQATCRHFGVQLSGNSVFHPYLSCSHKICT